MIKALIHEFMNMVENNSIEIYNEFSLQYELGIFLRSHLPLYKIQFERNTKFFGITGTVKHEIDIVIYNESEHYAIELKYPINGQYPEQMYSFIKDICFMEQLKDNGFTSTYSLTVVNDKNFYTGNKTDGIYSYFRSNETLLGTIAKPTGKKNESISLSRQYSIRWQGIRSKYYIIEIS